MIRSSKGASAAVTRTEVLFVVAAVGVIIVLALGFQFRTKFKNRETRCAQNIKDIVMGYNLWLSDHEAKRLPWMMNAADEGNLDLDPELRRQSWFQFSWISNELASPKALADPTAKRKGLRVANSWNSDPNGGFFHPSFRNNSCSYGLGVDFGLVWLWLRSDVPFEPVFLIDRHISDNGRSDLCWLRFDVTALNRPFNLHWGPGAHGKSGGNLGFASGNVEYLPSGQLTNRFFNNIDPGTGDAHFLFPDRAH